MPILRPWLIGSIVKCMGDSILARKIHYLSKDIVAIKILLQLIPIAECKLKFAVNYQTIGYLNER